MNQTELQIILSAKDELTKELKKTNTQLGKIQKELKGAQTASQKAGRNIKKDLQKIDSEATTVREKIRLLIGTFKGLGALRLFSAIGGLFALRSALLGVQKAMFKAADFEKSISDISTLYDDMGQSVGKLEEGIKGLMKSIPVDFFFKQKTAYEIVSAGISNTSEALKTLEASGKLATAGLSTTKEAANILTSALNTFKGETLDANEAANIIFKTVRAGKTTVAELSQAFGASAPIVEEVGVSFRDFQAATAALTSTGLPAAQAQNALRQAMTKLINPTAEMQEIYSALGMDGRELIASSDNLGEAFSKIRQVADAKNLSLAKVLGSVEALTAVLGVTGAVSESYRNTLQGMREDVDVLNEGFLKQQKTMTAQWQLVKNEVNVAMVELGSKVFPVVLKALHGVIDVVEEATKWWKKNEEIITGYVIPALASLITMIVALKVQLWALTASTALKTFFTTMIGGFSGLNIILGVTVLIKGFRLALLSTMTVAQAMVPILGALVFAILKIQDSFRKTAESIEDAYESMRNVVDVQISALKKAQDLEVVAQEATNEKVKELLQTRVEIMKKLAKEGTTAELSELKERRARLEKEIKESPEASLELTQLTSSMQVSSIEADLEGLGDTIADIGEAYNEFGVSASTTLLQLRLDHEETLHASGSKLVDLIEKYKEMEAKGVEAIVNLKDQFQKNLKGIDDNIQSVSDSISNLNDEFTSAKQSDRANLAQVFIDAEENVKSLKEELARATDAQNIFDLKQQIKEQESALEASKDIQKQFTEEIKEARRRAGLSDIERAIEDYNTKRELAKKEFAERMSELQAKKQALYEERALEIQLHNEKLAEQEKETQKALSDIDIQKQALVAQITEEVNLFGEKEQMITDMILEAMAVRAENSANVHAQTVEEINTEISLFQKLEAQIRAAASARSASFLSVPAFSGVSLGSRDTGGSIQQTGYYRLHQGEYVMTRRESSGGGNVVNINGGTYLSREVAQEIGDTIIDRLKLNRRI